MFMKRRKIANFNNNDLMENQNYPMPLGINRNNKIFTKFGEEVKKMKEREFSKENKKVELF